MEEVLKELMTAKDAICKAIDEVESIGWTNLCDGYDYSDDGRVRHRKKYGYKDIVVTGGRFYAGGRYWYFPKGGVPYQIANKCK